MLLTIVAVFVPVLPAVFAVPIIARSPRWSRADKVIALAIAGGVLVIGLAALVWLSLDWVGMFAPATSEAGVG